MPQKVNGCDIFPLPYTALKMCVVSNYALSYVCTNGIIYQVIHFISKPEFGYRILQQWYTFIFFEDLEMDKFYKRFVRDYVFYIDVIFCKAALIVDKLMKESEDGHFTTFHVRRCVMCS